MSFVIGIGTFFIFVILCGAWVLIVGKFGISATAKVVLSVAGILLLVVLYLDYLGVWGTWAAHAIRRE